MLLSEILDQLTQGELSQLYVSGRDEIGIQPCDYERIIPHINLALTELHKRFDLKRNSLLLQLDPSIEIYYLNSRYALSREGVSLDPQYIIDTIDDPFTDDVLKVEAVVDEFNNSLSLNDPHNFRDIDSNGQYRLEPTRNINGVPEPKTIYTPTPLSIKSSYSNKSSLLKISYRAKHRKIGNFNLDLSSEEVDIPFSLLEPLLYYIAARVYANMSEQDGIGFTQKFEMACKKIEELGLDTVIQSQNIKLDSRGFV